MNNKLKGFKEVFSFTFAQTWKSKATKLSFIIFLLFALLAIPIQAFVNKDSSDSDSSKSSPVKKIYVFNDTKYNTLDFNEVLKSDDTTKDIQIENKDKNDFDKTNKLIEDNENSSIIANIYKKDNIYQMEFIKSLDDTVSEDDVEKISEKFKQHFDTSKLASIKINPEILEAVSKQPITTVIDDITVEHDENGKEITFISKAQYRIVYAFMMISFFIICFSASMIASGIAQDKSTRVVEYLLTSVTPLALIVGKILSMLLFSLIEVGSIVACLALSNALTAKYISTDTMLNSIISTENMPNMNAGKILLCIIIILLGVLLFSIIAGLAGATISKIEELQEALGLYNKILLLAMYSSIYYLIRSSTSAGLGIDGYALSLIPFTSVFLLPSMLVIGKLSIGYVSISIAILLVTCLFAVKFTAKIYHALILYNGTRLKPKQLITLFKGGSLNE